MSTLTDDRGEEGVIFTFQDELVTATDIDSGVSASGSSKAEALSMLAEAFYLHEGGGDPIDDENAFLREIDIDPTEVEEQASPPPWLE